MNPRCPVCGQNLPQGLDEHEVQTQLERLTAPALARQKQRLDQDHKQRLDSQLAAFQRKAKAEYDRKLQQAEQAAEVKAANRLKSELDGLRKQATALQRRAEQAERDKERAVKRATEEAAKAAKGAAAAEARSKLERLQYDREQERARYRRENDQLRRKV
jgi:DNA repair exonuclease SbcCD ATPase subunit